MKCLGCGYQVEESHKFCSECGLRLFPQSQICISDGTISERQTPVTCDAEDERNAPTWSKTDTPLAHCSEEPGGNVRKKSEDSSNITEHRTETCQEEEKSSAAPAVDVPLGNTVTSAGAPTIPIASPIPPPHQRPPEHQDAHPSEVDVGTHMNEPNTSLPSSTSVTKELPEKTPETADLNTGRPVLDSTQPARRPLGEDVLEGTSQGSRKSTKSLENDGNTDIKVPDELKTSSNQTVRNIKNEANSQKCAEQSEIPDDHRVEPNNNQTQPPGPPHLATPELPEKTGSSTDESKDLVKGEQRSASSLPDGQKSYKDALMGASKETLVGLSRRPEFGANHQRENEFNSSHEAEAGDKPQESTEVFSKPNQEPENLSNVSGNVSKSSITDPLPANKDMPPNQRSEDRFQQESWNDKPMMPLLSQNTETFPGSDKITIYFHAIISKEYKLNPQHDRIFLRSGRLFGDWNKDGVEMNITRGLGKDRFLLAGQVMISIMNKNETYCIPYKYYVHKLNGMMYEGNYECIIQTSSNLVCNRVLIIKPYLLTHQGEWHQYDDIIYPEVKRSWFQFWDSPVETYVVKGRRLAGEVMLKTIFDLLKTWSEVNVRNFFSQLQQFYFTYSCPCVFDGETKPWGLPFGKTEVNSLLKELMAENVAPRSQKSGGNPEVFISDPLKAGIVILLVYCTFGLKEDDRGRLASLCQWLCLPKKPREHFFAYWTELIKGLPNIAGVEDIVESLCIRAREERLQNWILVIPLLHLLKGASKPFEPMSLTMDPQSDNWTGLKGIRTTDHWEDTREMRSLMTQNKHLVEVDHLLVRSWMLLLQLEDLPGFVSAIDVGVLDTLYCLQFRLTVKSGTYNFDYMQPVGKLLLHLIAKMNGQENRDNRYGGLCLKTAVGVLETICKTDSHLYEIPLHCLSLICLTVEKFLSVGSSGPQSEGSKTIEATEQALKILRDWRRKTLQRKLFTSQTETEVWNRLLSVSFGNKELNEQWGSTFRKDFEGKLNQEKPMHLVEIYCDKIEDMQKTSPSLCSSLEKCAIDAVTSICKDKSKLSELLKNRDFCKFGKLMSVIVLKSWPKTDNGLYVEDEELVMEHLLSWPLAKSLFEEQGANGVLFNQLKDEAKEQMEKARSAFCSVINKLITGNIQIKILNQVLKRKEELTQLLRIDDLCDDGRCQNGTAMKDLLKWREEEVEAVCNDKEMVDSLLILCHKLKEHLTIDVKELERKNLENIDLMNLDEFMEVHSFDKDSSKMTGVVTYFNFCDVIRQMASKLHAIRESFILTMCWEKQAKGLSHKQLDTNDEELQPEMEREVFTLDLIHRKIFQSSYDHYYKIYESLQSGTISLKEVDSIFEAYKGKYEDLEKELKIMCKMNYSDKGKWIKGRIQQIQQYHDIYLAFESAKVIMTVKETICPQGDFKVLQTLLDMNTEDFKEESLNCIDDNLLEIKKVLEDITEIRRKCLRELGLRQNFVKWVKEALEDINELKVFVDLASISAGENDMDVDRVACFHDAVLGYSSMLYGLPPDADFNAFKEALNKLWKALGNDCKIPNKLRDTARHLEWLKTVKDSHGSVELSSLSLASSINTRGVYIISAQNQHKLSLDSALKLQIPEQKSNQMRNYSLEDLKELQNKLMLMSGKGEQSKSEVVHFTEIFDGIRRLALAFVNLHAAGNPLFRCWEAKIHCNKQCDSGIIMDFNLGDILQEIRVEGNAMDQLTDLCRKIEMYLDDWSTFMDKQRSQHYYLNYYTAEQIVYLCDVLTEKNLNTKLDEKVLMMLSFIKPDCSLSDVLETWNSFQNNPVKEMEHDEENSFQTFIDLHADFDTSYPGEKECPIDVLQSSVDKTVGLRKLDLVWNVYMKDMRSILNNSLDTKSLGILLEMLANIKNQEEENGEDFFVLNPSQNTVKRELPAGLCPDQPNLILCPQDNILTSSICLYMTRDYEELPTYDEVLLCTAATSYEQVELFFRRCLTPGYVGEKIYTLLFADQLSYEVSNDVEKLFRKLSSSNKIHYKLVIICSADREHTYIPSAFSHFKRNVVPQESLESIRRYLSRHSTVPSDQTSAASVFKGRHFVGIVDSQRSGVGKSLYIQRLYEKLEGTVTMGTTFYKCIRLTEPKVDEHTILQSFYDTPESKKHKVFHLDVTSSVQKGLHDFLFKLFFLRYLVDSDGQMWKCSNRHLYVIETLQSTFKLQRPAIRSDPQGNFSLFEVFPRVFCRPPKEVMGLEMQNGDGPVVDTKDPLMDDQCFRSEAFQRPYQYLTRFHRGENLDSFKYQRNSVEGSHAECLQMLFIYCGIIDPSWAELRNFAWFLNLQLLDCETSVFCNFEFVGDTLRGFRNFVVDFMILMAKDFATPSLHFTDQSHGRQLLDNDLNERDLVPFLIRKRWESEPHPYIFFNDDHQSITFIGFHLQQNKHNGIDAINPSTNVVIKRNIMTRQLYNGLKLQRVPFNIDFDQLSRAEKIERLCSVLGIKWPTDPDETYELTTDNILKMMAIHMRFRCGIPVIIMGETGCGKTRLIKFLCELRRSGAPTENMKLVKVHGGTTSKMIYNKVREAEVVAVDNKEKHDFDSVLFFDEANTTEAITSIKEIMCDNTVEGQQLGSQTGLQIIAACNPYRKHTEEMIKRLEAAGLGYRVRAEETEERLGTIPLRQLVYRVQMLPPSMIPLVWDFGQLNELTEKMYIQQIVQRVVQTNNINRGSIRMITDVLSSSQRFMRERKDECSFVSLRDVERCMQVFMWFYNKHSLFQDEINTFLQKDLQEEGTRRKQQHSPASDRVDWSLLMAVGVCYQSCLENTGEYQAAICKFFPKVIPKKMKQEISLMQDLLLSGVPMGETIARNKALKENVFMMVICIELRIPLFLVGKPGSSKSLSKTLVADAMQGVAAHSELYKRLKQIHLVSFQCSPHSTPEGIINTFKQCGRFQESKNLEEYVSVVVLDEIGLAEDSSKMPLKTLHPLLEEGCIDDEPLPHKRVGFIGISNWALDPAKMNRGLFVSRGDPDENELLESANGICFSDKMILEKVKHLFKPFSRAYMKICKKGKGFFGLRDYYSLVKMMFTITRVSKQSPTMSQIIQAVLRNFSGKNDVDAVKIFTKELKQSFQPDSYGISTIDLVKQNISPNCQEEECRYLLVLTKNYAALQILQQTFFSDQNHPEIIFGSSFPKDQEYTQICRNINRVKICMETGQTVVLLNLQNLYESLYDALNQYYVSLGGQKYVDLGLGTHRVKCRVHKNFRLIVIEEQEVVYKQFPIPLINRLEKHYLDINTVLQNDQKVTVKQLQHWVGEFVFLKSPKSKTNYHLAPDVFIGYHSDTCSSVVLQVTEILKPESDKSDTQRRILDEAKLILLNCATPDSVIRLDETKLSADETEMLTQIYFEQQNHHSLADFIAFHTKQEEQCHANFTEVTTFSRLLTAADIEKLQNITELCNIKLLSLQQFDTEHSFLKEIRQFLDSTNADKVLIIQTDYDEDSQSMNILASAKYSSINEINKTKANVDNGRVFVYFVTKLPRIEGGTSYVGFHGGPWKSVHIDDLRKSKEFVSDIRALRNLPISKLFEEIKELSEAMCTDDIDVKSNWPEHFVEFDATYLVRSCVQRAVSMLRDQEESGALSTRRVEILLTLLEDNTFLTPLMSHLHSLLKNRERNIHFPTNWVLREACNISALQEGGTFTQTLWKRIQAVVSPLLAHLVSVIDRDRNLDLLLDHNSGQGVRNLWLKIFNNDEMLDIPKMDPNDIALSYGGLMNSFSNSSESKVILVPGHVTAESAMSCTMPFSWRIKEILDELMMQNLQHRREFDALFKEIPLGQYLDTVDKKLQMEFFQRYLQDFIAMTMKVASEAELKLLCEALSSCVNELQRRRKAPSEEIPSLLLIHSAYKMYRNRLHNLNQIMSLQPQVAPHLQRNALVKASPEMVMDVYAAVVCVEHLDRPVLDSNVQCRDWLKQVKRLQGSMELVCSQRSLRQYGERSREIFDNICNQWNRICILSLFVEHMVLGFESKERVLKDLVIDHTCTLGKILAKNSDVKSEEPFAAVIKLLKSCKQAASGLICKFGLQCGVCFGEPHDPVDLPCQHIFCLICVRECLNIGQMYCPMCKQELPDDFEIKVSDETGARINLNRQFRQSCNAFFIDLVTGVCFKDNIPPSKGVVLHLLSFLMVETEPVPLNRAQSQTYTKDFSPFDESLDKYPVIRSVILKLLLKYSFEEVKEYLQMHLTSVEESKIVDIEDKNELYALYINCLEDSMLDKMSDGCHRPGDQKAYLEEETRFLGHFQDMVNRSTEKVTIEYLQQIARVRLGLDLAAQLLHRKQSGEFESPQDGVEEFLGVVMTLCEGSENDWYRIYLIRRISSQQGVEFVQDMLKEAEYRWLFPEEVQQQDEDSGQMDQYLVYGEEYQDIREAVAKAALEGSVEEIEDTCQRCPAPQRRRTLYVLLALFREVTSLYRSGNTALHPTPEQCQALENFIQGSKYLNSKRLRDFATALIHNRMGGLSVLPDRSNVEHSLIEVAFHLAAGLLAGAEGLLTPLKQLGLTPQNMLRAFLPTMPEDMLAVAQRLIIKNEVDYGLSWYSCPNGHPCVVDKCGQPMEKAHCLECGVEIGGQSHVAVSGFQKMELQEGDLTKTGHILGDPQRRENPDTLDTKNMSLTPFILVRLLTHLAMLRGASEQPESIQQIIQPPVQEPCSFLIGHLLKDMDQLTKALGKGTDDMVTTVHLIVRSILEPPQTNQWPARYDSQLSTKEARNAWETTVASVIITPQLMQLDETLRQVNATIRNDSRVASNFVLRVTFGDECPLSSLPQDSQVHCSGVWSCRERVSLLSLSHIVEQNNGRENLPLLWKFLQKESEFRQVKFLPDILALQRSLVKKFQNSSDIINVSIKKFTLSQTASLRAWYEKRVQIFLNTWNMLRVSIATNEMKIPEEFWREDLDLDSDLVYLVPRRQGPGLCSTALLSHLVTLHNELVHSVDRHTRDDTSYKVSLSELTELHVIRYELEKDLLPLVLSNCQYSLERGKETVSEYDLPKIQKQILTRFLQGKPLIMLTGIPTLVTGHEKDYETIFKTVKGKVSQEPLPSLILTAMSRDLESYSEVCEALKAIELVLDFLSLTGGHTQMFLVRYLEDTLKMGKQTDCNVLKALGRCMLKHCVALWQLLSSLKSENMLKSLKGDPFSGVTAKYQRPLEEDQKRMLQDFIAKGNINTWLLEMHELLVLKLSKPHAEDSYATQWSIKGTIAGYMDCKEVPVPSEVEDFFPDKIHLSHIVETWKFMVTSKSE